MGLTTMRTGELISFEGAEGSGKTTQIKRVSTWLLDNQDSLIHGNGFSDLKMTREPGGTLISSRIRTLLLNRMDETIETTMPKTELLLYAADRTQHVEHYIKPRLNQGDLILCDRYVDSTTAYQGYGRQLDMQLIRTLNQIATDGILPSLTLWFDIDPEIGLQRVRGDRELDRIEASDIEFHCRVSNGFAELAKANQKRITRIDASQSEDAVFAAVQTEILKFINGTSAHPAEVPNSKTQ